MPSQTRGILADVANWNRPTAATRQRPTDDAADWKSTSGKQTATFVFNRSSTLATAALSPNCKQPLLTCPRIPTPTGDAFASSAKRSSCVAMTTSTGCRMSSTRTAPRYLPTCRRN